MTHDWEIYHFAAYTSCYLCQSIMVSIWNTYLISTTLGITIMEVLISTKRSRSFGPKKHIGLDYSAKRFSASGYDELERPEYSKQWGPKKFEVAFEFNNAAFSTIYFHDFWSIHNVFLCDSGFYYWKSTEFCFISESSYLPSFLDLLIRSFGHFLFTFWYSVFGINWTIILHWK